VPQLLSELTQSNSNLFLDKSPDEMAETIEVNAKAASLGNPDLAEDPTELVDEISKWSMSLTTIKEVNLVIVNE
jgi:hypothetical protein